MKQTLDELATAARSLALPANSELKRVTMALLLRAEIMEHFMEEIYEETRLLEVQHPTYDKLRRIRDLAIYGGDVWNRYFSGSSEHSGAKDNNPPSP